ncbi:uncharacterized protein (UPF0548 family) [Microbacteriaceae bacterium SG_E_30_P1]|uniref:Uncharacterized protein (UPF0548 family) n=1 Tax=Antiquaquibacter oligotrophicus TaxID=2880260 RepID=A0ABT6KMC2_9MICO|nr:DUF1990 domain-containing protein [Antiquaquibacter oligotrophicus]MDH6181153.1 uncharacterized protein (UPF0548 family) [Antiquaquibacter oligotrophicus]UDF13151.1 DUF1990 domain-containing protein [Antiquaquibacter oligotrophicus]
MGDSQLWKQPVTYAAIGATQAEDLLRYPPRGYRPLVRRARIGHGTRRFEFAWTETLSWGIQRRSGFDVEIADTPPEVTAQAYVPIAFDDAGEPVAPTRSGAMTFGPDGTPFLVPGDSAVLRIPMVGLSAISSAVRVVYVIDEPNRKGFGYGTLRGHPESGEESFIVEQFPDGSVWLTITSLSRPSAWYWWMVYPILRAFQEMFTRRYLKALAGPLADGLSPELEG